MSLPETAFCFEVLFGGWGKAGKKSEYVFIMRRGVFYSLPTHMVMAELCFLSFVKEMFQNQQKHRVTSSHNAGNLEPGGGSFLKLGTESEVTTKAFLLC